MLSSLVIEYLLLMRNSINNKISVHNDVNNLISKVELRQLCQQSFFSCLAKVNKVYGLF